MALHLSHRVFGIRLLQRFRLRLVVAGVARNGRDERRRAGGWLGEG
jgi:hypothetical protein